MTLFWLGLAWLAGIATSSATHLVAWQWLILGLGSLGGAIGFRQARIYRPLFLGLFALCLGAIRFQLDRPRFDASLVSWYNGSGRYAVITGIVMRSPEVRDWYTGLRIEVDKMRFADGGRSFPVDGRILARATRFGDWAYGDRVLVRGYLEAPPEFETFSYRDYLARQGIHSLVSNAEVKTLSTGGGNFFARLTYGLRERARKTIQELFPDPEASLLAGILIGDENAISPEVRQSFDETGTTHIIAISGFNITIIAAALMSLLRRTLGTRRGILLASVGIAFYTLLVGADAAVVRAAIMGSLTLFARLLGRQTHGLASLSAAAIMMTALDPDALWDVGFQLSFAATLGLMLYAPPLEQTFIRAASKIIPEKQAKGLASPVSEFVLFTFAAQITTLPLTIYYFQRLPLSSLLANPVILPAQPALMISGGLATLAGLIWTPLGRPLAWIAWVFPAFTIRAVAFFANLPLSTLSLGYLTFPTIASLYLILFLVTTLLKLPPEKRPRIPLPPLRLSTATVGLAILTTLLWRVAAGRPDGRLHLTLLDVGQGEAALIQSPTGRFLLVDGGPSPIALSDALGRRLPLFDRRLDWLILTGTTEGHLGGLAEAIPRFTPRNVLLAGPPRLGPYRYLMDKISEAEIPRAEAKEGQWLDLGDGARLEVFAVGDQGAVLLLRYGDFRFLLTSGADPALIAELMSVGAIKPVSGVLLPDGGNEDVNPNEWIERLSPQVALISVDSGNLRGLPSPQVLNSLSSRTLLRTDLHGWIELTTDGERMWVEVERGFIE